MSPRYTLTLLFFFFKQQLASEMRIVDCSSAVCSSDLVWAAFCRAVGLDRLLDDPEYEDWRSTIYIGDRKQSHGGVYRPVFAAMTSAEASDLINGLGGISVKFHDYAELLAHPQIGRAHV